MSHGFEKKLHFKNWSWRAVLRKKREDQKHVELLWMLNIVVKWQLTPMLFESLNDNFFNSLYSWMKLWVELLEWISLEEFKTCKVWVTLIWRKKHRAYEFELTKCWHFKSLWLHFAWRKCGIILSSPYMLKCDFYEIQEWHLWRRFVEKGFKICWSQTSWNCI